MNCITPFILLGLLVGIQDPSQPAGHDSVDWKKTRDLINSSDWRTRETAFHIVADMGCADTTAANAVFELIQIENEFIRGHAANQTAPHEGWGDPYYSDLLGHAFSCFKQSPKPEWFRPLALGSYNPDSPYAIELARYVNGNLSWLLATAASAKLQYTRANLYPLMVNSLAYNPAWPERERSAVLAAVWRGLTDPEPYVWISTAFALENSGLHEAHELLVKAKAELARRPNARPILLKNIDRAIEKTANTAIR